MVTVTWTRVSNDLLIVDCRLKLSNQRETKNVISLSFFMKKRPEGDHAILLSNVVAEKKSKRWRSKS